MAYSGSYIRNYDQAAEFLNGGRMKGKYRPISKNVYLARIDADTIALVLHSTAIVTYSSNKTAVIYTGGWWTVTTKAKISEFTRISPWGTGKYGVWGLGWTGESTPAKVQKCRARGSKWDDIVRGCKGTGQMKRTTRCSGPEGTNHYQYKATRHPNQCAGNVLCKGEAYRFGTNEDGSTNYRDHKLRPCQHGRIDAHTVERCEHDVDPIEHRSHHFIEACEHGQWDGHSTGTEMIECWQCKGTGVQDYGSKPIAIEWDNGAVRIDDDGNLIDLDDSVIPAPWAPGRQYDWTWAPGKPVNVKPVTVTHKKPNPNHIGADLADDLARVLPGLDASVRCPDCNLVNSVRTTIVHLNDQHKFTREAIADWLDTLDVDLAFKVA